MREINDGFKGFGCTTARTEILFTEIMKNKRGGGVLGGNIRSWASDQLILNYVLFFQVE